MADVVYGSFATLKIEGQIFFVGFMVCNVLKGQTNVYEICYFIR